MDQRDEKSGKKLEDEALRIDLYSVNRMVKR
jgi:hypothetical protein